MNLGNSNNAVVSAQNVTKRFGDVVCLKQVNLEVGAGEKVAVVGGNGSGKTVLLDVLCGFVRPNSGNVFLNGVITKGRHPAWFSRHGIIRTFQSPRVFEQMAIEECLTLAGWVPEHPGLWSSLVRNRWYTQRHASALGDAQRALAFAGWEQYAGQQAGQLSYGERKFLTILQLTLAKGDVAICDEPAAGLDSTQATRVIEMLDRWHSEQENRALIVATHDLEYVSEAFDRTYRISDGHLLEA